MPLPYKNTPDKSETEPAPEDFGHTLTIHSTLSFNQSPIEVYRYMAKIRTIVEALPELRVLRLVNGETYLWKLEYEKEFYLEGELRLTQKSEGDIVLWRTTESSPTKVSGSVRFHAVDEPQDSRDDERPSTRLAMITHVRVPLALQQRVGAERIRNRLTTSLQEALVRVKHRMGGEGSAIRGLRLENLPNAKMPDQTRKKDSPLG